MNACFKCKFKLIWMLAVENIWRQVTRVSYKGHWFKSMPIISYYYQIKSHKKRHVNYILALSVSPFSLLNTDTSHIRVIWPYSVLNTLCLLYSSGHFNHFSHEKENIFRVHSKIFIKTYFMRKINSWKGITLLISNIFQIVFF